MPGQIPGKLEVQTSDGSITTITLDGDSGSVSVGVSAIKLMLDSSNALISAGGSGSTGNIILYDNGGKQRVWIGSDSSISAIDGSGRIFLDLSDFGDASGLCRLSLGADRGSGGKKAGVIVLRDNTGNNSITIDGAAGRAVFQDDTGKQVLFLESSAGDGISCGLFVGANGKPGQMLIRNKSGNDSVAIDGNNNSLTIRGKGGKNTITLDGAKGNIALADENGKPSLLIESTDRAIPPSSQTRLIVGSDRGVPRSGDVRVCNSTGDHSIVLDGFSKQIRLQDDRGYPVITIDGNAGDILFENADCAEEFDTVNSTEIDSGTVMIIEQDGRLQQSNSEYDRRVAGVVSGAGHYKPGLVLDKKQSSNGRNSISLIGKVYCKVDAQLSPVEVGDLLTTSSTAGHAMKAQDPSRAFGAVIGKALGSLKMGRGLIPILIALQ